jgi:mRNA-degrading endonuclease toxin of MazEF toxin-antitoxin module
MVGAGIVIEAGRMRDQLRGHEATSPMPIVARQSAAANRAFARAYRPATWRRAAFAHGARFALGV